MKKITVIITGHSQGLGAALAAQWLDNGARVIGLSRGSNPDLQRQYPERLTEISLNLMDTEALCQWLNNEAPWREWCVDQGILWLFNNAGTVSPSLLLGHQGADAIAKAVALNVQAPLILSDAVAAQRSPSLGCNIVHISSGAAQKPYPGWSVYGACKAALDQHARNANAEHNGVDVVSIAPGVVDTAMQAHLRNSKDFPNQERFIDLHTQKQLQSPAETAKRIVQYCLSEHFGKQAVVDLRDLVHQE